jgi:hypothetical protein
MIESPQSAPLTLINHFYAMALIEFPVRNRLRRAGIVRRKLWTPIDGIAKHPPLG